MDGQNNVTPSFNPSSINSTSSPEGTTTSSLPTIPSIAVSKDGGIARGLGDKFAVSESDGSVSITVPIACSPGRGGLTPSLQLSHTTGGGNGPFGVGWQLSSGVITRKTDKGLPRYRDPTGQDSDVFVLSGTEDLVPLLEPGRSGGNWSRLTPKVRSSNGADFHVYQYRPRSGTPSMRVELWRSVTDPRADMHWRTISGNNITIYGRTSESRVSDPANPSRIFQWLVCEQRILGNVMVVEYKAENSENAPDVLYERNRSDKLRSAGRYIKYIRYGNRLSTVVQPDLTEAEWLFEIVFDYGEHDSEIPTPKQVSQWSCRNDPFSNCRSGFEIRTYRRCRRVLMFHHFPDEPEVGSNCLVGSTDFEYKSSHDLGGTANQQNPGITFLSSVSTSSYKRKADLYLRASIPPLELRYSVPEINHLVQTVDEISLENAPIGIDRSNYQFVDLDGEGLAGILTEQAGAWFYKRNLGNAKFGPLELVSKTPSLGSIAPAQKQYLLDIAGDGCLDLVRFDPGMSGFSKRTFEGDWEPFAPFTEYPNIDWDDSNLQFADVTGDGLPDIIVVQPDFLTILPSIAENGFGQREQWFPPDRNDEEKNPLLICANPKFLVALADMTGDGLADLVRIENGNVSYWPSYGYGCFGSKVTMSQSKRFTHSDLFDPNRIRLGDIDGSGTTDIIYLGSNGAVDIYFNDMGNIISEPRRLDPFLPLDSSANVAIVDLLAKGTGCLTWSSSLPGDRFRRISYIDLVKGPKPYSLISYENNFGMEANFSYAPSTKFYVQDRASGSPWITRVPFPVQVVERVETFDRLEGTYFVSRYAYHHGYYDRAEREFWGFGRVEKWDTEKYENMLQTPTNIDESSDIPPVMTKTWYDTGAFLPGRQISDLYSPEYYHEPDQSSSPTNPQWLKQFPLPKALSKDLFASTFEERRESSRTLRGSVLRSEVYAIDGTSKEKRPYSVSESSRAVRIIQPRGPNLYGCYSSQSRESISLGYDRQEYLVDDNIVSDPRISHTMTLAADEYRHPLLSLAVAYGRRYDDPDPVLSPGDKILQRKGSVTLSINQCTNAASTENSHVAPALYESELFELLKFPLQSPENPDSLVQFDQAYDIVQALSNRASDIPFEDINGRTAGPGVSRRPLNHTRTLFRRDDMTGPLPLGVLESLQLPFQAYTKVMTSGLAEDIYGSKFPANPSLDTVLRETCGFGHNEGDLHWWSASPMVFFSPNSTDTLAEEARYAASHFYLPYRSRDAFHSPTFNTECSVSYDPYHLLVSESRDAVGNRVTVGTRDIDPTKPLVNAGYDYRLLAPFLVMDCNRNQVATQYDVLGVGVAGALMGKPGKLIGDEVLDGFEPDNATIMRYLFDPSNPQGVLGKATTRIVYDLFAYHRSKSRPNPQPVTIATLTRETHVSDLDRDEETDIKQSFSYANGHQRIIQSKSRVDPDPDSHQPRWISSGVMKINNKGGPVRKFEPFFTSTHLFEPGNEVGVSSVLLYDPVGRVLAAINPDHSWTKTAFECWKVNTWDANDTASLDPKTDSDVGALFRRLPDSEYLPTWYDARVNGGKGVLQATAAKKAAAHSDTYKTVHHDPHGNGIVNVALYRAQRSSDIVAIEDTYVSRASFDIGDNPLQLEDAQGRIVETSKYDMLGRLAYKSNMDSGQFWKLASTTGNEVYKWNTKGRIRTEYDELQRSVRTYLKEDGVSEILFSKIIHGEGATDNEARNLRAKVAQVFDQGGVHSVDCYDFKGNVVRTHRQLAQNYKTNLDWSTPQLLENENFRSSTSFNALNMPVEASGPDGSIVMTRYNKAGQIDEQSVDVKGEGTWNKIIVSADYNAKGERTQVEFGNKVRTTFTFDDFTHRLTDIVTRREKNQYPDDSAAPPPHGWPGSQIQNLSYTYDAVGNVVNITDNSQQRIFFSNRKVEPSNEYTYDSMYQLVEASGREHLGQASPSEAYGPFNVGKTGHQHPHNGNAMANYLETYQYDSCGNIQSLRHSVANDILRGWTREYFYGSGNRLSSTRTNGVVENYEYSVAGSMISMPHLTLMKWNSMEQLQATSSQRVRSGTPETTWYVYDSGGNRIRKVTESHAATGDEPKRLHERIYIDGIEIFRKFASDSETVIEEREMLKVGGCTLIETLTKGTDPSGLRRIVRYRFGNHLNSVSLELDDQAQVSSYEEYTPFGSTSFQASANLTETPQRRRFTNRERDLESGLYYCHARYLAPWLGRWISCDPAGISGGSNLFSYVTNNPISMVDPTGLGGVNPDGSFYVDEIVIEAKPETAAEAPTPSSTSTTSAPTVDQNKPLTRDEQWSAAKNAVQNAAADFLGDILELAILAAPRPIGLSGVPDPKVDMSDLKAPEAVQFPSNRRERMYADNYHSMDDLLFWANIASLLFPESKIGGAAKVFKAGMEGREAFAVAGGAGEMAMMANSAGKATTIARDATAVAKETSGVIKGLNLATKEEAVAAIGRPLARPVTKVEASSIKLWEQVPGEPGVWTPSRPAGSEEHKVYEALAAGKPRNGHFMLDGKLQEVEDVGYLVGGKGPGARGPGGIEFDGYDKASNTLIDAKNYKAGDGGLAARVQEGQAWAYAALKKQAEAQLQVLPKGMTIEWRVASDEASNILNQLFRNEGLADRFTAIHY
jgi:RHS repeat-associated protein